MHPRLIEIGNYALPTYGVMAAIGLIFGLTLSVRLARRDGIDEENAWNLGVLAILSGVIGAKIFLILTEHSIYLDHPRRIFSLEMLQAGGVWYGGLIGGLSVGIWYVWRKRMPIIRTADAFAPGISLGHAFGRLGCFAAGCCYGKPTGQPWGVVFANLVPGPGEGSLPGAHRHPTQIYEFGSELLIFTVLLWLTKRRQFPGQVAGTYVFLYGIARFCIEFFRGDPGRGSWFGGTMSDAQVVSILMVMVGGSLWMRKTVASTQ